MYICNHMVKRAILIIVCELSTLYSHYLRAEKLNVRTHFTHTVVDSYTRYANMGTPQYVKLGQTFYAWCILHTKSTENWPKQQHEQTTLKNRVMLLFNKIKKQKCKNMCGTLKSRNNTQSIHNTHKEAQINTTKSRRM